MNEFYDFDRAREYLKKICMGVMKPSPLPTLGDLNVSGIWFQPEQHPPSDRMMHAVNGEDEELILTIRGILCSSTLPPLPHDRRFSRLPAAIRNLRQYVQVTGLGLPEFDSAVDKIRQIQDLYESSNAAYTVKDVEFTAYEGNKTIEAHARYFTDRYLMPAEKSIPFSRLVDPNGALAKLKPDSFIHGPDNVVEYCKLVEPRDDGKHRYAPCDPRTFKAGDIVEVAFTCIGIPSKRDRRCMLVNLKAITLLCDLFRKQADKAEKLERTASQTTTRPGNSKRRRLYVDMDSLAISNAHDGSDEGEARAERRSNAPRACNMRTASMDLDQ